MVEDVNSGEFGISDGVLDKDSTSRRLRTSRLEPGSHLDGVVSHYWILRWDLPHGERHTVSLLGRLGCSFVWTDAEALLYGVQIGRFTYELRGRGRITGAKLTPAGIRAFTDVEACELTDRTFDAARFLVVDQSLVADLRSASDGDATRRLDTLLAGQALRDDRRIRTANETVRTIEAHPQVTRVSEIAGLTGMSIRSLQKLTRAYVGAGTKWIIERLRVIGAVRALETDPAVDLARLALRLGYYDQAHLTAAFRAATGTTPHSYRSGGRG